METDFGTAFVRRDHFLNIFNSDQKNRESIGVATRYTNNTSLENHWLEAENADTITNPLEVAEDNDASGGRYIYTPQGTGSQYSPGPVMAKYHVKILQEGEYILWGRGKALNGKHNSFFVQIDDGFDCLWEMPFEMYKVQNFKNIRNIAKVNQWSWDKVGDRNNIDFMIFSLAAGEHTIKIKLREERAKIDKILLTNNLGFVPIGMGTITENSGYSKGIK